MSHLPSATDTSDMLCFVSYSHFDLDIVNLATQHRNATHGYEPVPYDMEVEWMVGQNDELQFWVPFKHRHVFCLPYVELIWCRPTKVDLSSLGCGSKWTECIGKRE